MTNNRHQITVDVDLDIEASFFDITPVMALEIALVIALADEISEGRAEWVAKDESHDWYWYSGRPSYSHKNWNPGENHFGFIVEVATDNDCSHIVHWKDSLIRIPPTNVKRMNEDLEEVSNE